ncbi:hypothetical protein Tco_0832337 [Tanacetum coccineum]
MICEKTTKSRKLDTKLAKFIELELRGSPGVLRSTLAMLKSQICLVLAQLANKTGIKYLSEAVMYGTVMALGGPSWQAFENFQELLAKYTSTDDLIPHILFLLQSSSYLHNELVGNASQSSALDTPILHTHVASNMISKGGPIRAMRIGASLTSFFNVLKARMQNPL